MNTIDLRKIIEEYEIITIFRHEHPDCDAFGSQFGLKNWISENYPNKQVYALGNESINQGEFPSLDTCEDSTIQNSLAIVLDTANKERVDDKRFLQAKKILKIDHHPDRQPFGDIQYVDTKAAATCEILATLFKECQDSKISADTAKYLYQGLLTDTISYSTSNTTAHTLEMGAYLAKQGINIPVINRKLFDQELHSYQFAGWIRSNIQIKNQKIAYIIIHQNELEKWQMSASEARNFVNELGHVKEFEVWCMFTQKQEEPAILYDGSLRSKTVVLNDLAQDYRGGGHPNASGVKDLTDADINSLLDKLEKLL